MPSLFKGSESSVGPIAVPAVLFFAYGTGADSPAPQNPAAAYGVKVSEVVLLTCVNARVTGSMTP